MASKDIKLEDLPAPKLEDLPSPDKLSVDSLPAPEIEKEELTEEEPSTLEAAVRGGARGLTGGLTGVAAGAGAAAGTFAGGKRSWEDIKAAYQEGLLEQREKEEKAAKAHPIVSGISEFAGAIPSLAVGGGALKSAGIASPIKQAGILGGATGVTNYLGNEPAPSLEGAALSGGIGTGLGLAGGAVAKGISSALNPEARALGQKGQTLFGTQAKEALDKEREQFANSIVKSISEEKGKIGQAYDAILDANKDKKIDLTDFVNKLKLRADNFDTSLPEQARDKKAIMSLINKITEGPEVEKTFVKGFKPGKTVEAVPSSQEQLEQEAQKLIESNKQLGIKSSSQITPSEDNQLLTRILKTESPTGPQATAKTIENIPGSPAYSEISPVIEQQTVREGGTLTPGVGEAKKLRANLGTISNEKALSTAGEQFADATYSDLTNALKEQIPGLAPTDAKYSALLKTAKKLGIKGNDEDVVRVLQKMTSDNQGKQIIVDQALSQLDKVNPNVSNTIRQTAESIDKKADLIDKVSKMGDYNIMNPKAIFKGLLRDLGGTRIAAGNIVGQAERKLIKTPAGTLVQKAISQLPLSTITNPFSQEVVQDKYVPSEASKISTPLYNATDDSLKLLATKLKQEVGLEFYGNHLNKAIEEGNEGEKNRAIFLMLQNPKSRKLITPEGK